MGRLSGFLKMAEAKAHDLLDKVPSASLSVRAYNPDGTLFADHMGLEKNLYTREKAEEWAIHLNGIQRDSNRPDVVWKVVEASEEPEVIQGEYVVHGEVRDSDTAVDGEIVDE